jgi:predicted PurR-regulated permease PerM
MFIIFIVYQQIENHILNPIIMSKTVKMSPALVLLAALAGAVLGGKLHSGFGTLIGALIGIPVGSALQVVIKELHSPQRIESGEPEAPSSIA